MFPFARSLVFKLLKILITYTKPDVQWLTTKELAHWLENTAETQPIILDARTEAEYAVSHLKNARRIDARAPDLAALKKVSHDVPIVVYCSVGYRSAGIAQQLQQLGFNRVYNLEGSIFQWANEGRPIFKYNCPTQFVHPYNAIWEKLLKSRIF
ncbi:rhodanese-like domain-containing protein [Argonema galeatum]|uniref:rhodanese-like domain-containing protein n=1 Tax=Argonema galeatum TaxID=2942762 RepID=UPI0020136BAD|nr:rhodanese-like domain-containing protein [Argonema galeatum]MCL1467655.1 rhodanese-like domain-containing protein [Argonema galeatum A003/A1]